MVQVMIVEDDAQTRDALAESVSARAEFHVQSAVGTVAAAMSALDANPDVLLVDLGLPDGSGEEVIRAAVEREKPPEIMVITVFGDVQHVVKAIEAGAAGYLLKDTDTLGVAAAIEELLAGGSPITPVIARHILKRFQGQAATPVQQPDSDVPHLTLREVEVLELVARGYTNNEIAELLTMSFHTVTSHIKHIYTKLSVRSRSAAIFEANQLGIIDMRRD